MQLKYWEWWNESSLHGKQRFWPQFRRMAGALVAQENPQALGFADAVGRCWGGNRVLSILSRFHPLDWSSQPSLQRLFLFCFLTSLGKEGCVFWFRTVWFLQAGMAELIRVLIKGCLEPWGARRTWAAPAVLPLSQALPCAPDPLAALKIYWNSLVFASPVCLLFMLKVSWKI